MANPEEKKSIGFNLFVDEKTYSGLAALINVAMYEMDEGRNGYTSSRHYKEATPAINEMINTLSDYIHEQGWCKDPDCEWKPKQKIS